LEHSLPLGFASNLSKNFLIAFLPVFSGQKGCKDITFFLSGKTLKNIFLNHPPFPPTIFPVCRDF
jgi:hypothetical protein